MALFTHEAFNKTSGSLEKTQYFFLTFHYAPQNCAYKLQGRKIILFCRITAKTSESVFDCIFCLIVMASFVFTLIFFFWCSSVTRSVTALVTVAGLILRTATITSISVTFTIVVTISVTILITWFIIASLPCLIAFGLPILFLRLDIFAFIFF